MFDIDKWREIFQTLMRNKSRSLLTAFGIFWGVFMLVLLMGGAKGMKAMMQSNFEGFAQNAYCAAPEKTTKPYDGLSSDRMWSFETGDLDVLRRHIPEAAVVTPVIFNWTDFKHRDCKTQGTAKGVSPDYVAVENPKLSHGRYIQPADLRDCRKVCVLGEKMASQLFPNDRNPVGKYIEMQGIYFQVVGISSLTSNVGVGGPASRTVYMPYTTLQRLLGCGDHFDMLALTTRPGHTVSSIQRKIELEVKKLHRIDPSDQQALMSINVESMFQMIQSLFDGINILVWMIGIGTLLSGSIGVSNIMMVVVKERTTEIGVRRALGAHPSHILVQILTESAVLTLLAGLTGIVFAVLILAAADSGIGSNFPSLAPGSFLISFSMAIGSALALSALGTVAGVAPALRALAIKPVDAMRDE